jgi:hypothetical protein
VEEEEVSRCSVCNWEASNCQCDQAEVMSDSEGMSDREVMSDEVMSDEYMDDDEEMSNEAADEEDRDQEYEDEQRKVRGYTYAHVQSTPCTYMDKDTCPTEHRDLLNALTGIGGGDGLEHR